MAKKRVVHWWLEAVHKTTGEVVHSIGPYTKKSLAKAARSIMLTNLHEDFEAVIRREEYR